MSGPASKPVSGQVLRNKGVPLTLHRVTETDTGEWVRIGDAEEELHVRMTTGSLADLEDEFGSMAGWQEALTRNPYSTVRRTLGLLLGKSKAELSESMREGQIGAYQTVLGSAYMLANGVDPDAVGKVHAAGLRDEDRRRVILTEETVGKVVEAIEAEERLLGESPEEPRETDLATATGTSGTKAKKASRTRGTTGSEHGAATAGASRSSGD